MSLENEIKKLREVIEINNKLLEQTLGQVANNAPKESDGGKCWSDKMEKDEAEIYVPHGRDLIAKEVSDEIYKSIEEFKMPTHEEVQELAQDLVTKGVDRKVIKTQVTKLGASKIKDLDITKLSQMKEFLKTLVK